MSRVARLMYKRKNLQQAVRENLLAESVSEKTEHV